MGTVEAQDSRIDANLGEGGPRPQMKPRPVGAVGGCPASRPGGKRTRNVRMSFETP